MSFELCICDSYYIFMVYCMGIIIQYGFEFSFTKFKLVYNGYYIIYSNNIDIYI